MHLPAHSEEFEGIDQLDPASVKELFGRIAGCAGRTVAVWMVAPRHLSATASPDVVSLKACSTD
ncbi:hypothetical protein [Bradyrhizobium algeriense]|uniref:hypothetical protein n=1 Tax=Bradyrhizobium algeriense TaxID=634784 RepID=UPI000D373FF9|nr:hypothetical protein [Bradyrhizobium algeriense]